MWIIKHLVKSNIQITNQSSSLYDVLVTWVEQGGAYALMERSTTYNKSHASLFLSL
jgi:hypothetical protein